MTCEERQDQFLLDAFGGLEPRESMDLRAHLATGCMTCAGSAAQASAIAAQFATSLPPVAPAPAVLDRLMHRVRASGQNNIQLLAHPDISNSRLDNTRRASRWVPMLASTAAAAVLAAAITAGIMWPRWRDDRLLRTPDLKYVFLAGSDPQPKARGRIFWDADRGYWHVYVFDLTPPPLGKTYELWFIGNDGKKTGAGLFDVDAHGDANLVVKVPGDLGRLAAAAVTDENAGGASQPTGAIQLLGKI